MRTTLVRAARRLGTIAMATTLTTALIVTEAHAADTDSPAEPQPTGPATAPPAGRVTIEKVSVSGSGCRSDTVAVAVAPDATAFTVTFSDYLAQAGAGARRPANRRDCAIVVRLAGPAGIAYAVARTDHRGFAHLEPGATATHTARYAPPGRGRTRTSHRTFTGPFSDYWQVTDSVRARHLVYVGCRTKPRLTIRTSLRVTSPRRAPVSLISVDSTDTALTSTYKLAWRRCR